MFLPLLLTIVFSSLFLFCSSNPIGRGRANACPYVNGTETQFHFYDCAPDDLIQVQSITVSNGQGGSDYPIDPRQPLHLEMHSINNGGTYTSDKVNVHLRHYTKGFLSNDCGWVEIPTLGLLDNLDGCALAHDCPLQHGPLTLILEFDLSPFQQIIHLLIHDETYELEVRMFDNNAGSSHQEIVCIRAQLRMNLQ